MLSLLLSSWSVSVCMPNNFGYWQDQIKRPWSRSGRYCSCPLTMLPPVSFPLLVVNVSVMPVCLLHGVHGCAEIGTLVHMIFGYLTLPMVIDTLLVVLAVHTFLLMWFVVICDPPPTCCSQCNHISVFQQLHQSYQHCCLARRLLFFCKLEWGEADVFIAVRGHHYDWVMVVESLFDNQRNIDKVGVSKRFFAVYIMQETLLKFCRMVKTKPKLNFFGSVSIRFWIKNPKTVWCHSWKFAFSSGCRLKRVWT